MKGYKKIGAINVGVKHEVVNLFQYKVKLL